MAEMEESALHQRLRDVVGNRSYRMLAEVTGTNPETARRYMTGHAPSTEFLVKICERFSVNGEWLLTGRGPMHLKDAKAHALQQATAGELLHSLARAIERLTERVDRLEVFVQTIEARVWARVAAGATGVTGEGKAGAMHGPQAGREESGQVGGGAGLEGGIGRGAGEGDARGRAGAGGAAAGGGGDVGADVRVRAERIADAVAKRPREDAP